MDECVSQRPWSLWCSRYVRSRCRLRWRSGRKEREQRREEAIYIMSEHTDIRIMQLHCYAKGDILPPFRPSCRYLGMSPWSVMPSRMKAILAGFRRVLTRNWHRLIFKRHRMCRCTSAVSYIVLNKSHILRVSKADNYRESEAIDSAGDC